MEIEKYVSQMKRIYESLLKILECECNSNDIEIFYDQFESQEIDDYREEFLELLQIISSISRNHHRSKYFLGKIEQILLHYSEQIKQFFTNIEIFNFFKKDKLLIHSLFENKIITVDENVFDFLIGGNENFQYELYFYPEIRNFLSEEQKASIEEELFKDGETLDEFEEKRKKGENDFYLCEIIRSDSVESFVIFVNQSNYSLNNKINLSIFESNEFLIKYETTLIQYAAFFGSIKIFEYLRLNNVELDSSLWFYAIHSNNAELFYLLENYNVKLPNGSYSMLLKESIKCHHKNLTNYIINNFLNESNQVYNIEQDIKENIFSYCFHYHNYSLIPEFLNKKSIFLYLCKYNYLKLVKLFLKNDDIDVNVTLISKSLIFF